MNTVLPSGHRVFDGVPCVSLSRVANDIREVAAPRRLSAFLAASGVAFADDEQRFVTAASVSLVGVGGLLLSWNGDESRQLRFEGLPGAFVIGELREALRTGFGASGLMTYLNPRGHDLSVLAGQIIAKGHTSIEHFASLNVLFAGISTAVETEFACQRDLVHLSRITVARTTLQVRPPVVLPPPALSGASVAVIRAIDLVLAETNVTDQDRNSLEFRNELYPTSKATATLITGSIRNLRRIADLADDEGKESEYRSVLSALQIILSHLADQAP